MTSALRVSLILLLCAALHPLSLDVAADSSISLKQFGAIFGSVSEPEGYFDSDNFVSNEAAYLSVLPALRRLEVRGGAYLGVGPDQNYSYIAEIQPRLAVILDIRRQNALQHLYFKALFQLSPDRMHYLARLFGRPSPEVRGPSERASITELLDRIEQLPKDERVGARYVQEAVAAIQRWGLPLSSEDLQTVRYVARAFIEGGPELKFTSHYRAARPHHPTYRNLLQQKDPAGIQANYLAADEKFRVIKRMHEENRIVPVVGDFAGPHALRSVGRELVRRGLEVRCIYASNVEFYLFGTDRWRPYIENLSTVPLSSSSYIIRSCSNMYRGHPAQLNGSYMTTILQSLPFFLANEARGANTSYWDIVGRDYILQ